MIDFPVFCLQSAKMAIEDECQKKLKVLETCFGNLSTLTIKPSAFQQGTDPHMYTERCVRNFDTTWTKKMTFLFSWT